MVPTSNLRSSVSRQIMEAYLKDSELNFNFEIRRDHQKNFL